MVVGFIQVPVGTIKDWLREQRYPLTNGILRPAHGNQAARANSFAGQRPRFLVYREACPGGPAKEWPEAVGILARGRASPGQRPCAGYLSWPCERCSSRFVAGVTLPQPACRQPVAKLGGRLAGADVEEHRGRDEADDLAAKRAREKHAQSETCPRMISA